MNTIEQFCRKHFNEPVVAARNSLGRIIGYAENDIDCYLIIKLDSGNIYWHSAVGGYVTLEGLKNQNIIKSNYTDEIWDDYYRIDYSLELNGCTKETDFLKITESGVVRNTLVCETKVLGAEPSSSDQ
jgi:hypothetical protein